jgi:hypothetical protein
MEEEEEKEKQQDKTDLEETADQKNREENFEFLRYLQEVQKFPLEMEALKTSIESNRSTVQLADESISHFKESRSDSRAALFTTLGVSVFTLVILIVQTFSTNQTEITKPVKFNSEQIHQILKGQEKNSLILSSQIDSMKLELKKLNEALIFKNKKKKP